VTAPQTWHHGLVADWWAEFNVGGPEIEYYGRFIGDGGPALDAGCGTGRLLVPWLESGYDVDGSDVSADMVARCRERARAAGFEPTLLVQPLHDLDPPRRYRTIVACGVFGLGTTRAQDEEGLRHLHAALEPGGTLLLDNEAPYSNGRLWPFWTKERRDGLPEEWREPRDRRQASDGSELALTSRVVAMDPLDQCLRMELRVCKWRHGELVGDEVHALTMRHYFRDELLLMLAAAGFADVEVRRGYEDAPPTGDDDFLVFVARRSQKPFAARSDSGP
jgi:SAM-dependent methyltransferase